MAGFGPEPALTLMRVTNMVLLYLLGIGAPYGNRTRVARLKILQNLNAIRRLGSSWVQVTA